MTQLLASPMTDIIDNPDRRWPSEGIDWPSEDPGPDQPARQPSGQAIGQWTIEPRPVDPDSDWPRRMTQARQTQLVGGWASPDWPGWQWQPRPIGGQTEGQPSWGPAQWRTMTQWRTEASQPSGQTGQPRPRRTQPVAIELKLTDNQTTSSGRTDKPSQWQWTGGQARRSPVSQANEPSPDSWPRPSWWTIDEWQTIPVMTRPSEPVGEGRPGPRPNDDPDWLTQTDEAVIGRTERLKNWQTVMKTIINWPMNEEDWPDGQWRTMKIG